MSLKVTANNECYYLKDLALGVFFKRSETAAKVYTRGSYDRSIKRYCCGDESDISRELELKGTTVVFVGFEY
jgi:hypothetical protein